MDGVGGHGGGGGGTISPMLGHRSPSMMIPRTLDEVRGGDTSGPGKVTATLLKTMTMDEEECPGMLPCQQKSFNCPENAHQGFASLTQTQMTAMSHIHNSDDFDDHPTSRSDPPTKAMSYCTTMPTLPMSAVASPVQQILHSPGFSPQRGTSTLLRANPGHELIDQVHKMETELDSTREQLGMLQQTVEGKMVHDPFLDFDRKMGNVQLLRLERARKGYSKIGALLFLIAIGLFVAESAVYLMQSTGWPRWRCRDLCGDDCEHGIGVHEEVEWLPYLPDCEIDALNISYAAGTNSFYAQTNQCYQPGFLDTWLRVVPIGTQCGSQAFSNATFLLSLKVTGLLLPILEEGARTSSGFPQPLLVFSNATSYLADYTASGTPFATYVAQFGDDNTQLQANYAACVWMSRDSHWSPAAWATDAAKETLFHDLSLLPEATENTTQTYGTVSYHTYSQHSNALQRTYAVWGSRREDDDCIPEVSLNDGTPNAFGVDSQIQWKGAYEISAWRRYVVILMRIRNDAHKAEVTALSKIGLSDEGLRSSSDALWQTRADNSLVHVAVWESDEDGGDHEMISNSSVRLDCDADESYCERFPVLTLWDTAEYGSLLGKSKQVTIQITSAPPVKLTWEEVQFQTFVVSELYTLAEAMIRGGCVIVVCAAFVSFILSIKDGGGWFALLPEQCWVVVFLALTIFYLDPFFILNLYKRRPERSDWAKFAYFMEVDMGYYAPYAFVAMNVNIILSAYTREERRDLFLQYIPMKLFGVKTPEPEPGDGPNAYYSREYLRALRRRLPSIQSGFVFLAFLLLVIVGIVGRAETDWGDRTARSDFGSTTLQDQIAMVLAIVGGVCCVYLLYKVRRKLRITHYLSSRRQQLLIRLVYFCSIPTLLCELANLIIDSQVSLSKHLLEIEDTEVHRRLGMAIVTCVYSCIMANALKPLPTYKQDGSIPPPSYREHWTTTIFEAGTLARIRVTNCTPYFFLTYSEELRWLFTQRGSDWGHSTPFSERKHCESLAAAVSGGVAAVAYAVVTAMQSRNSSGHEPYGMEREYLDALPLAASYQTSLPEVRRITSTTGTEPTDPLSINGSSTDSMEHPDEKEKPKDTEVEGREVDQSRPRPAYHGEQHLFNLHLAAEMSILSQEVYLNPPLRVLLKTSKILRRGPTPGCCVLAAAAVIPRTLFGRTLVGKTVRQEVQKKRKKRSRKKKREEKRKTSPRLPNLWCFDAADSDPDVLQGTGKSFEASPQPDVRQPTESIPAASLLLDKDLELYRDHLLKDELNIQSDPGEDSIRRDGPRELRLDSSLLQAVTRSGSQPPSPQVPGSAKLSSVKLGNDVSVTVRADDDDEEDMPRSARRRSRGGSFVSALAMKPMEMLHRAKSALSVRSEGGSASAFDQDGADGTTNPSHDVGPPPSQESDGYVVTMADQDGNSSPVVKRCQNAIPSPSPAKPDPRPKNKKLQKKQQLQHPQPAVSPLTTPAQPALERRPSATGFKKWLGFGFNQDPYADCHDEYRFEPNSEAWGQNISRSFMDLNAFGWALKSLLDRKDNRAMVCTKQLATEGEADLLVIAVVFRGTRNTSNLKSDLQINRHPYAEMADRMHETRWHDEKPCAHRGFTLVWEMLKVDLMEVVATELQKAADLGLKVRVVCTGHSLGGALATLASYAIARAYPSTWVSLYNYGTPRVGNTTFCKMFKEVVPDAWGMVHPADPVPNHPPKMNLGFLRARYEHPFRRVRVDTYGNCLINPSWIEGVFMDCFPMSLFEPFDTVENIKTGHSMKTYRTALRAICNFGGQDHGLQASLDRA